MYRAIFVLLCDICDGCALYMLYKLPGMYICYICDGCGYYKNKQKNSKLCRVLLPRHSAKRPFSYFLENGFAECYNLDTLPSASRVALGKVTNFAECRPGSTRQSVKLRRVPTWQHSANFESLPSAFLRALGKVPVPHPVRPSHFHFFCRVRFGTRQKFAECSR